MTVDFDIIVTYCNHRDPHYFTGLSYDPAAMTDNIADF